MVNSRGICGDGPGGPKWWDLLTSRELKYAFLGISGLRPCRKWRKSYLVTCTY